jgi:hypothetical protein
MTLASASEINRYAEAWRTVDEFSERQQVRFFQNYLGIVPKDRGARRRALFRLLYNMTKTNAVLRTIEAIRSENGT